MKPKVLVSAPYALPVIDRYKETLSNAGIEVVVADVNERLEEEELLSYVGDVAGIICGDDRITARVLDAAPQLKVISKWGTGIDSIDCIAAKERGVIVCNTPNAFSEPVADTALGYMLLFARQFDRMTDAMRNGKWEKPQLFSLREKTLGIIGVGNCGKAVARRAKSFGMKLLGADPLEMAANFLQETGIQMVPLDQLLAESNIISLHADLNPTSKHIIDSTSISKMQKGTYLVNTARGPLIEETALIRNLESGHIAGVGLDVYEVEPLPVDSPLRRHPNAHLSPHNANSSPLAAEWVHQNTLNNLITGIFDTATKK